MMDDVTMLKQRIADLQAKVNKHNSDLAEIAWKALTEIVGVWYRQQEREWAHQCHLKSITAVNHRMEYMGEESTDKMTMYRKSGIDVCLMYSYPKVDIWVALPEAAYIDMSNYAKVLTDIRDGMFQAMAVMDSLRVVNWNESEATDDR